MRANQTYGVSFWFHIAAKFQLVSRAHAHTLIMASAPLTKAFACLPMAEWQDAKQAQSSACCLKVELALFCFRVIPQRDRSVCLPPLVFGRPTCVMASTTRSAYAFTTVRKLLARLLSS